MKNPTRILTGALFLILAATGVGSPAQAQLARQQCLTCEGSCDCYFTSECSSDSFCSYSSGCTDVGKKDGTCTKSGGGLSGGFPAFVSSVDLTFEAFQEGFRTTGNPSLEPLGEAQKARLSAAEHLGVQRIVHNALDTEVFDLRLGF